MLVDFLDMCNRFSCGNSLEVLFLWEDISGECTEGTVRFFFVSSMLSLCFLECKWSSQCVLGNELERPTKGISLCFKKKCILGYGSLHFCLGGDNT